MQFKSLSRTISEQTKEFQIIFRYGRSFFLFVLKLKRFQFLVRGVLRMAKIFVRVDTSR